MSNAADLSADRGPGWAWVHHAPLTVFLAGTFVWAWILWGYWLPTMPASGLVITPTFVITAIIGGLAPSLSALFTLWMLQGRAGVGRLLHELTHWRAPPLYFLLAIGMVPTVGLVSAALQPIFIGPLKAPDPSVMAMAAIWPLLAALGEELGWRGFLLPRLARRYGAVGAALIVGLIWGVWHLPADYVGLKGYGGLFWLAFVVNGPYVLTAHSLIMAWLWRQSRANLVLMVIYHWSITASAMLAPTAGGQDAMGLGAAALSATLFWLLAIGLWLSEVRKERPPIPEATGR